MIDERTIRDAVVLDFESLPIGQRPDYPPPPVGLAVDWPGQKPKYLAFGHPLGGNTHTFRETQACVAAAVDSGRPLLFHNSKFDVSENFEQLGIPMPWDRVHDTMPMLFLRDPRAATYALKPSSEAILGLPPEERDVMVDWLIEHQPIPGLKLANIKDKDSPNYAGKYIAYAPVSLVGPYAIGDVVRTRKLASKVAKELTERRMLEAYERERQVIAIAADLERQGVRVDVKRLATDVDLYQRTLVAVDAWLCKRLKAPSDVNWDSSTDLAKYLIQGGAVDRTKLALSKKTGKPLTNKEVLAAAMTDKQVGQVLIYRAKLCTCLRTFMVPWLDTARRSGGLIFTTWHSTRTDDNGARTGRFSSTPNFQNMPKETEPLFHHQDSKKGLPKAPIDLPPLPFIRSYVVTFDEDDFLIDRDYSQQELRILGHYEDGRLKEAYVENPWLDLHSWARTFINQLLHTNFDRKPIKNTGFGIVYGLGLEKLAKKNGCDVEVARQLRDAYKNHVCPGIAQINDDMKRRARANEPIRTWGGREYYCEPPRLVDGRMRSFDYRLLNLLIQGSAADCTKEWLIRYYKVKPKHHRVLTIPHDEILASVPRKEVHEGMRLLKEAAESVEFDVPMLSEGKISKTSWGALQPYDKEGKRVHAH